MATYFFFSTLTTQRSSFSFFKSYLTGVPGGVPSESSSLLSSRYCMGAILASS